MPRPRSFKTIVGGKKRPPIKSRTLAIAAFGFAAGCAAGVMILFWPPLSATVRSFAQPPAAVTMERVFLTVVDGDTLKDPRTGVKYRLANIDTPETGDRARCAAERDAGDRATAAARDLVAAAHELNVAPTGRIDQYGRVIAFVAVDGSDLGELLVARELARPWSGRRRPWCDGRGGLLP